MDDAVGDRDLNRLPQRRLELIDGSISSYCSIIRYPEQVNLIKQANSMVFVLDDTESDRLGAKEDRKKREVGTENQRKQKS